MNETLQRWLQNIRVFYGKLSTQKKVMIGLGAFVVALGATAITIYVKHDPYQMLFTDLQNEDGKAVAKKLSAENIPYRVSEDNTEISVPASRVYDARMQLAKEGVPGQDVVGFEKFDASTLGMSSYIQRIQYIRAVQGELTRSISRLASVKRARVHISIPPKKTFLEDQDPPKGSVVLELKSGQTPSKAEITGIAHLVASAVEGLKVTQVTIVDNRGNFLHRPEEANQAGMSTALLEQQRSIETEYERRIEDLLVPVVGMGKVRAKVTAEVDASRINTTEESYDPDRAVARSSLKTEEINNGAKPNPVGIPGSRSNLPGAEVENPPMPMATINSEKITTNNNYAIPRKIQITDKPSGSIKRLTVAVVVDGIYTKAPGSKVDIFAPRGDEELNRIRDVVANAVGFDNERRDSISVTSMPFNAHDLLPLEEIDPAAVPANDLMQYGIRNGVIGLVILLFFFFVMRPFMKWATTSDIEEEIAILPRTVAELEAGVGRDSSFLALSKAASILEEVEPLEKKEESELMKKIEERLGKAPKKGLRIIQDWLDEEGENRSGGPSPELAAS